MWDQTTINTLIGLLGLLIVGGGALVSVTFAISTKIAAVESKALDKIVNAEKNIQAEMDKRDAEHSKARHDLRNSLEVLVARQEVLFSKNIERLEVTLNQFSSKLDKLTEIKIALGRVEDRLGLEPKPQSMSGDD